MPSAKRRFDRGPVSLTVYNRHNQHKHETWHDVKARQAREKRLANTANDGALETLLHYTGGSYRQVRDVLVFD